MHTLHSLAMYTRAQSKSLATTTKLSAPDSDPVVDPVVDPGDLAVNDLNLADLPQEDRMNLAIAACTNPNRKISINMAASAYRVVRSTLQNQIKGMQTRQEAHTGELLLSKPEEQVLAEWIKVSSTSW